MSMVLQEIEGFSYATALDLNMGYHTIRLDPDASSKQLGAVITQDNRPIVFFSWKLSDTQRKYSINQN